MIKVKIINNTNGKEFAGKFPDQEKVNKWLANENHIRAWGGEGNFTVTQEDITEEVKKNELRKNRDVYLRNTDKYFLNDPADLQENISYGQIKQYRRYLRDVTKENPLPEKVKTLEEFINDL